MKPVKNVREYIKRMTKGYPEVSIVRFKERFELWLKENSIKEEEAVTMYNTPYPELSTLPKIELYISVTKTDSDISPVLLDCICKRYTSVEEAKNFMLLDDIKEGKFYNCSKYNVKIKQVPIGTDAKREKQLEIELDSRLRNFKNGGFKAVLERSEMVKNVLNKK